MRSRSRSSHPSTRLDSNARPTTGASVRAELEQTPRPPPRLRPSTEHHHSTDRTRDRSIDRSIDRRASLVSRLAVESDRFLSHALPFIPPRRRKQSSEKPPRRHSTHSFMHRRLAHALVCILVGFRNPAPRVPSRHRASTRERFTNRIDPSRVRHQSSRATDGRGCSAPRWGHTHTHARRCVTHRQMTHTPSTRDSVPPRGLVAWKGRHTTHDSRLVHSTHRSTRLGRRRRACWGDAAWDAMNGHGVDVVAKLTGHATTSTP